jgi:hypothetical protein
VVFGLVLGRLVEDRLDHRRGELLRRQAVAPANDPRRLRELGQAARLGLGQRADHVEVERLAHGARLLGAVEHDDVARRLGEGADEMFQREGAVEPDLDKAHLFALGIHPLHRFVSRLGPRAHHHDHALGVGRPHVVEQAVLAAGHLGQPVHLFLDQLGTGQVEPVAGLARLEEGVGVLGGAAQDRVLRGQRPLAVRLDRSLVQHGSQLFVVQLLHLDHLVRGAEAVEEVQEGDPGAQGGGLAEQGEIVSLLDRSRGEQGEAGLPAGHHVGMVAEDRQRVGRDRARRDVHAHRRQLAGDLVHVGDHQQQALRGGEGRREGAGLQRSVHRSGSATFRLHLHDLGNLAPDVLATVDSPLVTQLAHRR